MASEGSYGSHLVHTEEGSTDRLVQHDLRIPEQVPDHIAPPYLFDPCTPGQARRNSSCPDATFITPCPAEPNKSELPPHIRHYPE
eukprot:1140841-Pelagomonas_calceolata.AAC.2